MAGEQQHQLDTRAIEIAAELKGSLAGITDVLNRHLNDCLEERRNATLHRNAMRLEITDKIESNTKMTISGLGFAIVLLLGIAGTLFVKLMNW